MRNHKLNKKIIFFSLILFYTALIRWWEIGQVPQLINPDQFQERIIFSTISLFTILLLYIYSKSLFSPKITLISAWVYSLLPWSQEQGRLHSIYSLNIFIFLIFLIVNNKYKNRLLKSASWMIFIFIYYLLNTSSWLFNPLQYNHNISNYFSNIYSLASSSFLFFHNTSFWWGGVREFGVMYISYSPFFLIGILVLIQTKKNLSVIYWMIILTLIGSLNPQFPEGRDIYLLVPFLSLTVSIGIMKLTANNGLIPRIIMSFMLLFMIYELSQFFHYYYVHYPRDISDNISNINVPF